MMIPFHKDEVENSVVHRFELIAKQFPAQYAIKTASQALTYHELDHAATRLAQNILTTRGERKEAVAILVEHGIDSIIAMLGVLKAGKFYVGLVPAVPPARLTKILNDSEAGLLITNTPNLALATELTQKKWAVLNMSQLEHDDSDTPVGVSIAPDDLATLSYTSGSTNVPKGVESTQRNILHSAWRHTQSYGIYSEDHISYLFSYGFAASKTDVFGTLLNGATLYPVNVQEATLAHLLTWLQQEAITIFRPPVGLFRQLLDALTGIEQFPKLRLVILSGQIVYTRDIVRFRTYFPSSCLLSHTFGTTETGRVMQWFIEPQTAMTGNIVPVGYTVDDKEVLLFDETGREVGVNNVGEIAVRSRYLSPGYWRNPELTRQKFLPDPEGGDKRIYLTGDLGRRHSDGCLEYLGRKDFQVKIRGYRVELVEIEATLYNSELVKEAVVVAKDAPNGDKRLIAYLVPSTDPSPTVSELQKTLAVTLPEYMMPSCFVFLDALPVTPTGKVDRQALPEPGWGRPELATELVTPRNDIESHLVQIFETILHVQPIGVQDNFFELGGDSLSYLRLFTEIEKQWGHTLSVDEVTRNPTIEHLAAMLQQQESVPLRSFEPPPPISHNPFTLIQEVFNTPQSSWAEKFRHARHILLHQLRHIGPDFDDFTLPYAVGTRFLSWFCSQRWVHTMFFQHQKQLIRQCLTCIEGSSSKEAEVIRHSLLCNFWSQWRIAALEHSSSEEFERWVPVTGFATVQRAYEKGQGVILATSHLALVPLIESLLDRQGVEHAFIGGWQGARAHPYPLALVGLHRLQPSTGRARNLSREAWRHTQLPLGRQILQQGGIVRIGADGYQGECGLTVPFHGRLRPFYAGFAELAVTTGADVLPVRVSLDDETGQVQIIFLEPLDAGSANMNHQARIESLIRQYIEILEKIWATDLGSVGWTEIEKFLALPPISHTE